MTTPRAKPTVTLCAFCFAASAASAQYIQKLAYQFTGATRGAAAGADVSTVGDINADGYDDLIFGSHGEVYRDMFAAGTATVISGYDGSVLFKVAGEAANERFGTRVAGGFDFNNDATNDFMASSFSAQNYRGYTKVFSGIDGALLFTIRGDNEDDRSGAAIDGVGDINADGHDDFIIGDAGYGGQGPEAQGRVRVFSGKTGEVLYSYVGRPLDTLYSAVGQVGDLDQDGVPDFVFGAPGAIGTRQQGQGVVAIMSGATGEGLRVFSGDTSGTGFAENATPVGDLNNDGFPELAIGSPDLLMRVDNTRQGNVQIFNGIDGSPLWKWWDPGEFSNFGDRVSGGTDLNGDGSIDIAVGAPWSDTPERYAGAVAILSTDGQPSLNAPSSFSLFGKAEQELFGWAIETRADLNNDGIGDLVVTAPYAIVDGVARGAVYVYVSTPGYLDGDANASGAVDINDAITVLFRFGDKGAPGIRGDVNADGVVNTDDLNHVLFRMRNSE